MFKSTIRFYASLLCIVLAVFQGFAQQKTMCITIDDLPTISKNSTWTQRKEITSKLLVTLQKHGVQAVGFVNEDKLYHGNVPDTNEVSLLKQWLSAGMELGNHTFSHPDYHKISLQSFVSDIVKGEKVLRPLLHARKKELLWFRHPFLHIGQTNERADSLSNWLGEHGYMVAPVTIENYDYLFAAAYDNALSLSDETLKNKIGAEYLSHTAKALAYYEEVSNTSAGRAIPQVMLIHANTVNADYLDSLLTNFEAAGYKFIPLAEALQDSMYTTKLTKYGNYGIPWNERWIISSGQHKEILKKSPQPAEYIYKIAGVDYE
ncbi:MAG: polysaccharide deacetylase family protein [Ignavibacteria bacterium]|nr:polysaccharide deacetylase family protein [Ignavibacteria bacterium]